MQTRRNIYLGGLIGLVVATTAGFMLFVPSPQPTKVAVARSPSPSPNASPEPFENMPSLLGASATTPAPSLISLPIIMPTPAPPKPIWSDEFSGPSGTLPDPAKWNIDVGGGGWGNDEWQYYTDSPANAAHDGQGHLVITAHRPASPPGGCDYGPCDITSARLQTEGLFSATYGRFEARIKVPAGRGLWPAFWMLSNDDVGEIDIMENNGRDPSITSGTMHGPGVSGAGGISAAMNYSPGNTAADAFHVFAVAWTPQAVTWYVDGQAFQTVRKGDPRIREWVYDRPYYLLLNMAVGSEDPGYPDATTPFPARLVVDYVRVYR